MRQKLVILLVLICLITNAASADDMIVQTGEIQPTPQPQNDEWANKIMAKVEEQANIRANANEEGELVGHLPQGASGDIVEKGDQWTKISSGTVVGYVKNDYRTGKDRSAAVMSGQKSPRSGY